MTDNRQMLLFQEEIFLVFTQENDTLAEVFSLRTTAYSNKK